MSALGIILAVTVTFRVASRKRNGKMEDVPKHWMAVLRLSALGAPIIFTITQNFGATMVLIDLWTIAHTLLICFQVMAAMRLFGIGGKGSGGQPLANAG